MSCLVDNVDQSVAVKTLQGLSQDGPDRIRGLLVQERIVLGGYVEPGTLEVGPGVCQDSHVRVSAFILAISHNLHLTVVGLRPKLTFDQFGLRLVTIWDLNILCVPSFRKLLCY